MLNFGACQLLPQNLALDVLAQRDDMMLECINAR